MIRVRPRAGDGRDPDRFGQTGEARAGGEEGVMNWARTLAISLAGSSLVLLATPARAEADARTFLDRIAGGDTLYLQILNGYANGLAWANTWLGETGQPKLYCPPPRLSITAEQNADILRRYLTTDPTAATAPAGLALLLAYRSAFPCTTNRS